MTPILGIMASQISGHLSTNSYESIATVTIGAGGASSASFSSIPSIYKHLQIRGIAQNTRATYGFDSLRWTFNGVGGTSYSTHGLRGDGGGSAQVDAATSAAFMEAGRVIGTNTGGTFGGFVLDVLDYTAVTKYKTSRIIGGVDVNGTVGGLGGSTGLFSGLFMDSSNAITSITFTNGTGSNFNQYSSFALYGVKG
jgi:hypothetical protein